MVTGVVMEVVTGVVGKTGGAVERRYLLKALSNTMFPLVQALTHWHSLEWVRTTARVEIHW